MLFKAQLFALTGVQPERQKVMLRGTTLKDDSWSDIASKIKDVFILKCRNLQTLKILNELFLFRV